MIGLLAIGFSLEQRAEAAVASKVPETKNATTTVTNPSRDDYRSRHFLVHTDLCEEEAEELLERLECTLNVISKYWGRRSRGTIECYVVEDLANWEGFTFPHPFARILIAGVGGVAYPTFERTDNRVRRGSIVYCIAKPGVAEHEAVHAYCLQSFPELGPEWYKEGMAQMAYYQTQSTRGVCCGEEVARFLRSADPKSIQLILEGGVSAKIRESLSAAIKAHAADNSVPTPKQLREHFHTPVQLAKNSYRWDWALCHFMSQNPNYSARFRTLGQGYLNKKSKTFGQFFGSLDKEVCFEFRFFMKRIDDGYRVDLCAWDWKKKFRRLETNRPRSVTVAAARGFQASGVLVNSGQKYAHSAEGMWSINANQTASDANGNAVGRGRLVGVVMTDYTLSEPFELGIRGSFTAPADGQLYLRCRDAWNELADNSGRVKVRLAESDDFAALP